MNRSVAPLHGWDSRFHLAVIDGEVRRVPRIGGGVNTAYATPQTTIGLIPEVTRGVPLAPSYWFKVKAPKYKPDLTMIEDDTLQGSMVKVYETIPGLRYDSHSWDSFLYMDVMPLLAKFELGSTDTVTTATASTTMGAVAAGVTAVTFAISIATGAFIVIDTGGLLEANYVKTGGTSATLQFPLNYAHGALTAVTVLTGHSFSLLNNAGTVGNQPPSATITDFDGEEWRQLAAAQLDKLTIKGNATGLADYSSTWFANPSITPTPPTAAFTVLDAAPGWTAMVQIGGVSKNYVMDWEVDLSRSVKPIPALTGTQEYFMYFADAITCPGKLTVIEQSGAPELTQYQSGAAFTLDIFVYDRLSGDAMYIHSSKCRFKTGEIDRSKTWVEAPLTMDLLPTSTDAGAGGVSPLKMMFGNTQVTAY
jgi:hypothetical protein